jgi:WD40-like Beta Propeller Repeat
MRFWLSFVLVNAGVLALAGRASAVSNATPRWPAGFSVVLSASASAEAWSGDGKHFAYGTTEGIRVIDVPDFDHPHLVAREPSSAGTLWSPDGSQLAFIGGHPGEWGDTVWLVNNDGSGLKDLLPPGARSPHPGPQRRSLTLDAWLPHNEIAFSMGVGTNFTEHLLVDPENDSIRELCTSRGPIFWAPQNSIAAIQNDDSSGDTPPGLGLLRISGSSQSLGPHSDCSTLIESFSKFTLAGRDLTASFNAWSPDGTHVLYTRNSYIDGTRMSELYLWDVREEGVKVVMNAVDSGKWSWDGKFLAAVAHGKTYFDSNGALRSGSVPYSSKKLFILDWPQYTVSASLNFPADVLGFAWSSGSEDLAIVEPTKAVLATFEHRGWRTESIPNPFGRPLGSSTADWFAEWSPDGEWLTLRTVWLKDVPAPTLYILRFPRDRPHLETAKVH